MSKEMNVGVSAIVRVSGKSGLTLHEFVGPGGGERATKAAQAIANDSPENTVSMMIFRHPSDWIEVKRSRSNTEELIHFIHGMSQLADVHRRSQDRTRYIDIMADLRELQAYRLQEQQEHIWEDDTETPALLMEEQSPDPTDSLLVDDLSVFEPEAPTEVGIRLPYVIHRVEPAGLQPPQWFSDGEWVNDLESAVVFANRRSAQNCVLRNSDRQNGDFFYGLKENVHYAILSWKEAIAVVSKYLESAGGLAYGARRCV